MAGCRAGAEKGGPEGKGNQVVQGLREAFQGLREAHLRQQILPLLLIAFLP